MIYQLLALFLLFITVKFLYSLLFDTFPQMAPYKKTYHLTEEDFN
jgi:hypothetical protein